MKCGLENGAECFALKEKNCDGCNFFKTAEQIKKGRQDTIIRLKRKGLYDQTVGCYPKLPELFSGK